jgi:hypothetical protein
MCIQKGTPRFRIVEVDCAAIQEYSLQNDDILSKAKSIIAIEAFRVANVTLTPKNRTVVNDAVFLKSFLTIATQVSDEILFRIPFINLSKKDNNGMLFMVNIPPIAMSKCKITVANTAGLVATETWLLAFHYE